MKFPGSILLLVFLITRVAAGEFLPLPHRALDAPAGTALIERLINLPLAEREETLTEEILAGNVPAFLRALCPVELRKSVGEKELTATAYVTPDYLAVGSDEDYLLAPLRPATAQRIADQLDCLLPTPPLVDAIHAAAPLKVAPLPLPPSPAMTTMAVIAEHNRAVIAQRSATLAAHPLGTLTAGQKKDVVLTPALHDLPGKVAIYGWHRFDGSPIQPLYTGHTDAWVDYSHGIRLVSQKVIVAGTTHRLSEVLADPTTSPLLSETPISEPRYQTIAATAGLTHWNENAAFDERQLTVSESPNARIHFLASAKYDPGKPTRLIIYALPNGNTLEETLGHAVPPDSKSKFGIQQIAAQTRFLRKATGDDNLVLACVEAKGLSWPTWRKQHGDAAVVRIVNKVLRRFAGAPVSLTLSGHSGGGSFVFGYINSFDQIPDQVERIAFLDANYGYETEKHAAKLANWLESSARHQLCVLAYRDHVARWEGKPFVSESGGTAGRSKVMLADLAARAPISRSEQGDLHIAKAVHGRAQFFIHQNPQAIILHTVQVERNGFIHSMLTGTRHTNRGYRYMADPAYSEFIVPE